MSLARRGGLLLAAAAMLQACQPPPLILRSELVDGKIVITFHQRGFFGQEYRISPCIRMVILEGSDQRRLWQISGQNEPSTGVPCRELASLTLGEVPAGYDVDIPFDVSRAPPSAILSVSSAEGDGGIRMTLSATPQGTVRAQVESRNDGELNWLEGQATR